MICQTTVKEQSNNDQTNFSLQYNELMKFHLFSTDSCQANMGGIREKVLAAHRAGARTILLPEENMKDTEGWQVTEVLLDCLLPCYYTREAFTFHSRRL